MNKKDNLHENIYSGAVVRELEQQYCTSYSSAVISPCLVSSMGLAERVVSRIYNGGRHAVYTAAVGAMLMNNMALPAQAATVTVSAGETSTGLVVSSGTAVDAVDVYGKTSQTEVYNGGIETIYNSGRAYGTTVNLGGRQDISGGAANSTTINSGGVQNVYDGGEISYNIINGGEQYIFSGGVDKDTTLNSGANQYVSSGGSARYTSINLGGNQYVYNGGEVEQTIINSGGSQTINSSGVANSTTINSGGSQTINSSGVANSTTINSGGYQYIPNGGVANSTTINSGGSQYIYGAVNDTVMSGGNIILDGGTLNNLTATGGELFVSNNNALLGNINLTNTQVTYGDGTNRIKVENLSANNAVFNMNVDLENQTGDDLHIEFSYEGNSLINLTNTASSAQETSGDGIKLVNFEDGASVNGTFDLAGGQWDEGAYVYKLFQGTEAGTGNNYYLRSTGERTDTFKTMLNMPIMNVVVAQTGMNSLQKRMGDLRNMDNRTKHQGVWVRSYYKDLRVKDLIKTDMSLFGAEAGYDWLFRAEEPTKLYAGVMVGYAYANNIKTHKNNGTYDKGDGDAPSIGMYATLLNEEGWFIDLAARNFWTKLDMKNHSSGGTELLYKPERNVVAASVEVGKEIEKELSRNEYVRIEPKLEIGYMNAEGGHAKVTNGVGDLHYDNANYINAKAGVLLAYNKVRGNGLLIEPLIELAYRQEFAGKDKISYGGAEEKSKLNGGTFEVNAGLNMEILKDLYWYGLGSYEASNKVSGWGLHAGIRYTFGNKKQAANKLSADEAAALQAKKEAEAARKAQQEREAAEAAAKKAQQEREAAAKKAKQERDAAALAVIGKTQTIEDEISVVLDRGIVFESGRNDLSDSLKETLNKAVELLNQIPERSVVVEGHTDSIGSEEYNMKLSEKRAKSIYDYMIGQGLQIKDVSYKGYGETKPIADNNTEEGRAANRRVELKIK